MTILVHEGFTAIKVKTLRGNRKLMVSPLSYHFNYLFFQDMQIIKCFSCETVKQLPYRVKIEMQNYIMEIHVMWKLSKNIPSPKKGDTYHGQNKQKSILENLISNHYNFFHCTNIHFTCLSLHKIGGNIHYYDTRQR